MITGEMKNSQLQENILNRLLPVLTAHAPRSPSSYNHSPNLIYKLAQSSLSYEHFYQNSIQLAATALN